MKVLKLAATGVGVTLAGVVAGCVLAMANVEPPMEPQEEPAPPIVEVPILNLPDIEEQAEVVGNIPKEMPSTATGEVAVAQSTSYNPYCNAPPSGYWAQYSDEEWCTQQQWLRDNDISTEDKYVARYSGVCPEKQPQNIHSAEWVYYATVGGRTGAYPTPEHYAESYWNSYRHGRFSNLATISVSNFANMGLANTAANRQATLYLDLTAHTAYWESTTGAYDTEWDSLAQRFTVKFQALETKFVNLCE